MDSLMNQLEGGNQGQDPLKHTQDRHYAYLLLERRAHSLARLSLR